MTAQIMTEVRARVDPDRETELMAAFQKMTAGGTPDGLLRTELLRGSNREWRIQTLWRDRAALDAMREGAEQPVAPRLFREVGAEPHLQLLDVVHDLVVE